MKYKHKKTGEIATYKDGVLKSSRFCVEIGVEPSSEFWEEVKEIYPIGTKVKNLETQSELIRKEDGWYKQDKTGYTDTDIKRREGKRFELVENSKKLKPVLFTTADGVDIKEGDIFYQANLIHGVKSWTTEYPIYFNKDIMKTLFSSKEKAEQYILLNKPCLSIIDIQSIYISAKEGYNKNGNGISYFEQLKTLVKSKL